MGNRLVVSMTGLLVLVATLACGGGGVEDEVRVDPPVRATEDTAAVSEARARAVEEKRAAEADAAAAEVDVAGDAAEGDASPDGEPSSAETTAMSGEWSGSIVSGSKSSLVMDREGGDAPPVGATGAMSRQVKQKLFGADITAWLVVGEVKVTRSSADSVTVEVVSESSEIVVNGEKVDHFKPGGPVKLDWSR